MTDKNKFCSFDGMDPSWQPPAFQAELPSFNQQDAAVYVAELTSQLEAIAKGAGHDLLAYALSMAAREATLAVFRETDFINSKPQ